MAGHIFKGLNYVFSPQIDIAAAIGMGLTAAYLRIRREETCNRLGLPSYSMISLIAQERSKFDNTRAARSRLSLSSWYLGDSLEADILRQDAMLNKIRQEKIEEAVARQLEEANPARPRKRRRKESDMSRIPRGPLLSKDPATGELVLGPLPPSSSGDGTDGDEYDEDDEEDDDDDNGRELSPEEQKLKDERFKQKYLAAQPDLQELAEMFVSRGKYFCISSWQYFWDQPWFFEKWGQGWDAWQASSSEAQMRKRKEKTRQLYH